MKRVLLDSNVLIADFHRESGPIFLLFDEANRGEVDLVVPEIVVAEVVEKFRDELAEAHREYGRWRKKLIKRMRPGPDIPPPTPLDIEAASAAFELGLRTAIENTNGRIVGFPKSGPTRSVRRDIRGGRPFAEGRGWRDALIWEIVLEELVEDDVVFVSADNDFRSGDGLHPELLAEAVAMDGGELRQYRSLRAYVDAEVEPAFAAAEQARQLLLHNERFRSTLETQISEELISAPESELEHLDFFGTRVDLTGVEVVTAWPETIDVLSAQALGDGRFNLDLRATIDAEFDVYLFKYDAWSLEPDALERISDFDHNESVARANLSMLLDASMSAMFTPATPAVDAVWLDAVIEV